MNSMPGNWDEPQGRAGQVKCWCRKCKQEKRENEMFAGIIHPDGIGRGVCVDCYTKLLADDFTEP